MFSGKRPLIGGNFFMGVLFVFLALATTAPQAEVQAQTKLTYLGCYKDTFIRDLNGRYFNMQKKSATAEYCIADCKRNGFKYAAIQNGNYCSCGNSYGQYGGANNCNMACKGNWFQKCGGGWANSVYSTVTKTTQTGIFGNSGLNKRTFCNQYAKTANVQQKENLSGNCRFRGGRWKTDYTGHYNWCMVTPNSFVNNETNLRRKALAKCRNTSSGFTFGSGTTTNKQAFCKTYVKTAVSQHNQNVNRRCGITGPQWSNLAFIHQANCSTSSIQASKKRTQARKNRLAQCGNSGSGFSFGNNTNNTTVTSCSQHVTTALAQQNKNYQQKCGLKGPLWNKNVKQLKDVCNFFGTATMAKNAKARRTALASCFWSSFAKKGNKTFCQKYVATTKALKDKNFKYQCGLSGSLWNPNTKQLLSNCKFYSPKIINQRTKTRRDQLGKCNTFGNGFLTGNSGGLAFCKKYVRTALIQQRQNINRKCGLTGGLWKTGAKQLQANCSFFDASLSNKRSKQRRDALAQCGNSNSKSAKPTLQNFCRSFAHIAIVQQRQNIRKNCRFQGNGWHNNYWNHFSSCLRNPKANSQRTRRNRNNALNNC